MPKRITSAVTVLLTIISLALFTASSAYAHGNSKGKGAHNASGHSHSHSHGKGHDNHQGHGYGHNHGDHDDDDKGKGKGKDKGHDKHKDHDRDHDHGKGKDKDKDHGHGHGHGKDKDSCHESDGKGKGKGHDKKKGKGHEHHKGKGKGHSHGCGDDDEDDDNNDDEVVTAPIIEGNCAVYYAGQHTVVGSVCLTIQDDTVFVDYLMEDGWKLTDPHLWIGNTLASAPRTHSGNPIPGQFPFSADFHGKSEYTFEIPVSSLAIDADAVCAGDSPLLVAAHGSVSKGWKKESAWAGETRFVKKGNWATYFGIAPECGTTEPEPEPEPELPQGCFNVVAFGGENNSFANLFGSDDFGYVVNGEAFFSEFSAPAITAEGTPLGEIKILSLAMGDPADGLYVEVVANTGYSVRKTEIFAGDVGGYAPDTAFSESNNNVSGSAAYMFPAASSETLEVVVNAVMCEVDVDYTPSF